MKKKRSSNGLGSGLDATIMQKKKKQKRQRGVKAVRIRLTRNIITVAISRALQKLFDFCRRVFQGPGIPSADDVRSLRLILDSMKAEDVGLSRDLQFFKPKRNEVEGCSRVTSATIYKCKNFELCIFFLPANGVIPLHNHPGMTVFSKLLLGTMHVKAYDWVDPLAPGYSASHSGLIRLAKVKADRTVTAPCNTSVLYPTSGGNIHEVRAITACAMLDVLAPPYSKDEGRDCWYYKDHPYDALSFLDKEEIRAKFEGKDKGGCYGWLEEIEIPGQEMEGIEYKGPKIIDPSIP